MEAMSTEMVSMKEKIMSRAASPTPAGSAAIGLDSPQSITDRRLVTEPSREEMRAIWLNITTRSGKQLRNQIKTNRFRLRASNLWGLNHSLPPTLMIKRFSIILTTVPLSPSHLCLSSSLTSFESFDHKIYERSRQAMMLICCSNCNWNPISCPNI